MMLIVMLIRVVLAVKDISKQLPIKKKFLKQKILFTFKSCKFEFFKIDFTNQKSFECLSLTICSIRTEEKFIQPNICV